MAIENLRSQSIEEVLDSVAGLSTVGTAQQMQSILAVIARCTIDLGENLQNLSAEVKGASTAFAAELKNLNGELAKTRDEMKAASAVASKQAGVLSTWTKVLVVVTEIYTLFTGGLLLNAIFGQ